LVAKFVVFKKNCEKHNQLNNANISNSKIIKLFTNSLRFIFSRTM